MVGGVDPDAVHACTCMRRDRPRPIAEPRFINETPHNYILVKSVICEMARTLRIRCLLLLLHVSATLGSHFRGAIFMVRPSPGGGENEVATKL